MKEVDIMNTYKIIGNGYTCILRADFISKTEDNFCLFFSLDHGIVASVDLDTTSVTKM